MQVICFLAFFPLLLSAYEAPEDKEDIFASKACPAFLIFESSAFLADTTIELPCHCKPEEVLSVVWYYQKQIGSVNTKVLTDFEGTTVVESSKVGRGSDLRSRFTIRLFSLLIFRVQKDDSGHYICGTSSGEFFYGYSVDVQEVHRVLFPWNLQQTTPAQISEPSAMRNKPFHVFTSYRPWSKCDRCDIQGEQVRVGLCYVKTNYLHVRYHSESDPVAPCGSRAIPQQFGLSGSAYGAEVHVRSCHAPCPPKPKTSQERQALLKFLDYGDQASGVPIHFHNHPVDLNLILTCPGAKPQYAVAWDKGSTPLYRSQYIQGLNKTTRVFIDPGHHLHIRPVRLEDKGSYFCWLQGKLSAEIRLGVNLHLARSRQISDPESVYALQVIFVCYIVITVLFLLTVFVRFVWQLSKEQKIAAIK
ncbi:Ig-like V-type domain-containing protein FAM187A [Triplophysa dalaica]|uniref:Ig-like V-type domain-containing protein FAM187A n=1 Tax=Triplophysa dalaica TaxID=1582913 RepID=UPI0024DFC024|nr:Ig-like V-type domain-containing protein FAM187A [Triplophysa dalaica]